MQPNNPQPDAEVPDHLLDEVIAQKRADLNKLTVQGETIINDAQRRVDGLEKRAEWLKGNIAELEKKERELTQKVADLSDVAERTEAEVSEKLAALRTKEQDIEIRERAIANRERRQNAQLRRNLM
jgi:chaperonin cofactor prefoldin